MIKIDIDWTLLVQAVNFFILLLILQRLLFRPLRKIIEGRQEEISGSLGRVRELEEDIAGKQTAYSERLESVRDEARQQREAMRQMVTTQQAQLIAAAHEEVEAARGEFKERISTERRDAATVLRAEAERLAGAITRKIAGRAL